MELRIVGDGLAAIRPGRQDRFRRIPFRQHIGEHGGVGAAQEIGAPQPAFAEHGRKVEQPDMHDVGVEPIQLLGDARGNFAGHALPPDLFPVWGQ